MSILRAPAKINLFLHVTNKLENGYHELESLVVFAQDIFDIIEIEESSDNCTSLLGGEFAQELQFESNNLIDKALMEFSNKNYYHCKLSKNIPIGAGLGGGSSDAAAVAKYLNYTGCDLSEKLLNIGADLPICYNGTPAFLSGVGQKIQPVKNIPNLHLVLINCKKRLLTQKVFSSRQESYSEKLADKPVDFFYNIDKIISFLMSLKNDLSDCAISIEPEIKYVLHMLQTQEGCVFSRMSGSGATCFGLFDSLEKALKAEQNISIEKPEYWVRYSKI